MPFDVSGIFTRVHDFEQDRDNGIKILATRVDAEFDGIANGLSETYLRDGRAAMSGDIKMGNNRIESLNSGSLADPAISFNSSANTGVYSPSAGQVGLVANGVERLRVDTTGVVATTVNVSGNSNLNTINIAGGNNISFTAGGAIIWGTDGRIFLSASGATYRAADHEFFNADGSAQFGKFSSTGLTNLAGKIELDHNNQTNVPCIEVTDQGAGVSGIKIERSGGQGHVQLGSNTGSSFHHYHENRNAIFEVANNGFDATPVDAFTMRHSAVLTRNVMALKHMTAASTGKFLRGLDSADAEKFSIASDGGATFGGDVAIDKTAGNARFLRFKVGGSNTAYIALASDDVNMVSDVPSGGGYQLRINNSIQMALSASGLTSNVPVLAPAATTSIPSIRLPHGAAPSAPTNGDLWTTTAGLFAQINGVTVGPLAAAGGGLAALTMNNGGAGAASGTTYDGSIARTISYNTIGAAASGAITGSGLTIATARLAGRTTAGTGAIEEISVGSTLSLTGGVLSIPSSVALAGNPTTTTQAEGDNSTRIATTAYVDRLKGLVNNSGGAVTLAIGHRGELYQATGNVTCPNAVFAAGDVIRVYNNSASSISIVQGASVTMRLAGTATTGTRTLAQRGIADILYVSSSECVVSGVT